jgi:hypothetical protein
MGMPKQPRQNPNNPDELWCNCWRHRCYSHKSNFTMSSKTKSGYHTSCKEQVAAWQVARDNNRKKNKVNDQSFDRSKWKNYKQYMKENPFYCKYVLGQEYSEELVKKNYKQIFGLGEEKNEKDCVENGSNRAEL